MNNGHAEAILEVHGLRKSFGRFVALNGVELALPAGERRAVIGPNGAGKTTLVNVLDGQLGVDGGEVLFEKRPITGLLPFQIARLGIGRTFQISSTMRRLTVFENMLAAHDLAGGHTFSLNANRLRRLREPVMVSLEQIQLAHLAEQTVESISHGDRKRLEFGMVLAGDPRLLLLDEPTAGMGLQERHDLMDLVLRHVNERKLSLLFIEHDIDIVFRVADRITVMAQGKVFAEGTPDDIARNEEVQRIYLGTAKV